jgi:hypothetical protein
MQTQTRIPNWLIGGVGVWLAYAVTLSFMHMRLLDLWGAPSTLQMYSLNVSEPISLPQILLLGIVALGFFIIEGLSLLRIHIPWMDAAIYNWRTMVLLSSLPAFIAGALISTHNRRLNLAGAILAVTLLGGSLLFILNRSNAS